MLTPGEITRAIKKCTAETTLFDTSGERGGGVLMLVIRPTLEGASARWVARWDIAGKRQKLTLGRYPDLGLRDAREEFETRVRQPLVSGKNPRTTAIKRSCATVEALFEAYITKLQAEGKSSWDRFEGVLLTSRPNCADRLGRNRPAADVTPGDIVACIRPWFDAGSRRQADVARTAMQAAFNFGLRSANSYTNADTFDWGLTINPAAMVEKDSGAVVARDRNLSVAELRALWRGLEGTGFYPDTADAIRLILLCGQRVRETLRADGRDFDLDAGVWNMPGSKTKGGKPHSLPLPASAVPIVHRLVARHGPGTLFPARQGANAERLGDTALNRALRRWCEANDIELFQPRDLRRTWKSRAGEAGVDRFTRDLIQQHAKNDTGSRHYDRADYLPQMREGMAKWDVWFTSAVK